MNNKPCPTCGGAAKTKQALSNPTYPYQPCPTCGGKPFYLGDPKVNGTSPCRYCNGTGAVPARKGIGPQASAPCLTCNGTGIEPICYCSDEYVDTHCPTHSKPTEAKGEALKARLIELDLLEQALNQGRDIEDYKMERLKALTEEYDKL